MRVVSTASVAHKSGRLDFDDLQSARAYSSFTAYNMTHPATLYRWIGLRNYQRLFENPDFWWALGRTVVFLTVALNLEMVLGLGVALLLTHDRTLFWGLGLALGLFVGPAQAASRSLMARMAPGEQRAAYFGLFALSGRVTGFLGPAALSLATAAFQSQRAGMAVIVVLLALGAATLARVPSPRA